MAVKMAMTHYSRISLLSGLKDGIPIGLGYFAVSFSLGVAAKSAGLDPFQGFLASFLCHASAGEYIGFLLIGTQAPYWEIALATLIANLRYLLMSCALSQKCAPSLPFGKRALAAFGLTDELFGIAIARKGAFNFLYFLGGFLMASPFWTIGTALGVLAGNLLPSSIVSALSVALFGMFLAIIIPKGKEDKKVLLLIIAGFVLSFLAHHYCKNLSSGTRTIILTVLLSLAGALLFPREEEEEYEEEEEKA